MSFTLKVTNLDYENVTVDIKYDISSLDLMLETINHFLKRQN
jgi:hypothetical protein